MSRKSKVIRDRHLFFPLISWEYDKETDVLYISIDKPKKALGVDIGVGAILRYMEETGEIAGLILIGIKERLLMSLKKGINESHKDKRWSLLPFDLFCPK